MKVDKSYLHFRRWFRNNKTIFHQGAYSDLSIALSAFKLGIDYALKILNAQSESLNVSSNEQQKKGFLSVTCSHCGKTFKDTVDAQGHRCVLRKPD